MSIKLDLINKMNNTQKLSFMLITLEGQLSSEKDNLANLSNAAAIIKAIIDDLNWSGFYLLRDDELVLGPFQGLPACNRIKLDSGVCGACVTQRKTMLVPDVDKFEGHIACDSASRSELVVPIIKDGKIYGVLDLDSPSYNRFTEIEKEAFEKFVDKLNKYIDWEKL